MKHSILLVDDDPNLRDMLRQMLEIGGFDVVEAEDGLDALEKLEEMTPDIMVLDVMMPNLDGVSLCKQLRSDTEFMSLPIIMLSGKTQHRAGGRRHGRRGQLLSVQAHHGRRVNPQRARAFARALTLELKISFPCSTWECHAESGAFRATQSVERGSKK